MTCRRRSAPAGLVLILLASTSCTTGSAPSQVGPQASTAVSHPPSAAATLAPDPCDGGVRRQEIVALPVVGAPCWYDPDWDQATSVRVEYTLPTEGWNLFLGPFKDIEDASGLQRVSALFVEIDDLSIHGCATHRPLNPAVGPEVTDLAEALAATPPFEVTSPPTDVTAYGYSGQHVEIMVPLDQPIEDGRFEGCQGGTLESWITHCCGGPFYGYVGPGDTEEFWILDVDGTRLAIIAFTSSAASPELIAERQEILDSIVVKP
jgi:hypothetical protein